MKITENNSSNAEWLEPRERAIESVLYLYNTIRHRFEKDSAYGEQFVKENQQLIGTLTMAAIFEVNNTREERR